MHAAVVRSFGHPPHYESCDVPAPGTDEVLVDVLAVALHPRVRSGASGSHYSSTGSLPMVPGIDAVGRLPDGRRIYFVASDDTRGTMADKALSDPRRSVLLPDDVDVLKMAAAMNPAMSSWVALRRRVPLQPGSSVLVLGATGNAGGMAIQVAKLLGAGHVVGAGRNPDQLARLGDLGADVVVPLDADGAASARRVAAASADVDVVLDYLWGAPASEALMALLRARSDRSHSLDWIQIGAMAGPTIELPSVALRSRLQGSGQGSVSPEDYRAELPSLVAEIAAGSLAVNVSVVPLASVATAWIADEVPGQRTVFTP